MTSTDTFVLAFLTAMFINVIRLKLSITFFKQWLFCFETRCGINRHHVAYPKGVAFVIIGPVQFSWDLRSLYEICNPTPRNCKKTT